MSSGTIVAPGPSQPTYPEATPGATPYAVHDASADALPEIELDGSLILLGDASRALARLPRESCRCVVTSPPYWGLRDYGIQGQIGSEETLTQYLNGLVRVFREMRRVLTPDGTFWLNLGDGYTSGNRGWRAPDKKNPNRAMSVRPDNPPG